MTNAATKTTDTPTSTSSAASPGPIDGLGLEARNEQNQTLASAGVWLLWLSALTAWIALLSKLANTVRATAFSTAGDALPYFLPLIKTHTDAVLGGEFPRVFWNMGAGWSPWESGQVGVLYPIYHLSNVISRAFGKPLELLEVSAWIHLFLAGFFVLKLLPRTVPKGERLLWALLAATQPAPIMLGANWHAYLAAYPWIVALAIAAQRSVSEGWNRTTNFLVLTLLSLTIFLAAHPQIWFFAIVLVGLLTLVSHPSKRGVTQTVSLALAQLLLVAPALYLRLIASNATVNWMHGRGSFSFILAHGQALSTVLTGLVSGEIVRETSFKVWNSPSPAGASMFFLPALLLLPWVAYKRASLHICALAGLVLMILASDTFEAVALLFPSAIGFRWTWKFSLFLFPLFGTWLAINSHGMGRPAIRRILLGAWLLGSLVVALDGLRFDLLVNGTPTHASVREVVDETRDLLRRAGVRDGARLALVESTQSDFVRFRGLVPNAQVLAGYESAAVYEPLEHRDAAAAHLGLSVPWRTNVKPEDWKAKRETTERNLSAIGVEYALSSQSLGAGEVVVHDADGRALHVVEIRPDESPFRVLDGGLLWAGASNAPPPTPGRSMTWKKQGDGSWRGTPEAFAPGWLVAIVAGLLAWLGALFYLRRAARPATSPCPAPSVSNG